MKLFLDFAPVAAFLAVLLATDIYLATAVLLVALWASVLAWRLRYGSVRKAHLLLTVAGTVLGGLTLYLHNATFIKWKPTVVYLAFAGAMAVNLILGQRPFMKAALHEALEMPDLLWRKVEFAWIGFWLACGALNLLVAYNFSDSQWGVYKVVSAFVLPVLFMLAHWPFISPYAKESKPQEPNP